MNRDPLDRGAIDNALESLHGWEFHNDRLIKTFEFTDFREAIAFIVRIGFHADALNHHPILTNVYSRVGIELTTHSAGNRVTQLDVLLAQAIEQIIGR